MTIFLDEQCVSGLVTMQDALEAVEEVFREQGKGTVLNVPRIRAPLKDGVLRITAGILSYRGYYGIKITSTAVFGRSTGRTFYLYREETGDLCAIVQVFGLGTLRTGAASGIASKYLANGNAAVLGVLGSGRQARTQVEAVSRVRPIREVKVFSPTMEHRARFCRHIEESLEISAIAMASAEKAVTGSDIIVAATTSSTPVVHGQWLAPGTHLNAVGANHESRRELDQETVVAANFIATDDLEQVRYESAELVDAVKQGLLKWESVFSLANVVSGHVRGRSSPKDITLFKSLGVATEDVALAVRAYEKAVERKVGQALPDLTG